MLGINTLYPFSEKCSPIVNTDLGSALYPCKTIAQFSVFSSVIYSVPLKAIPSSAFISTFLFTILEAQF